MKREIKFFLIPLSRSITRESKKTTIQANRFWTKAQSGFIRNCIVILIVVFSASHAYADGIILKNGKEIKGLVVERHADRVIFSTEKGEIPILLSGIKNIEYDDAEQNFMQIGRGYESENKYGEALAFYEKALEINPNFDEARKAATAMRSRFWASATEGPQSEMDKQQDLYDSWGMGKSLEKAASKGIAQVSKDLRSSLGLVLTRERDWVRIVEAHQKKDGFAAGLRRQDRLVSIDTQSLRYLNADIVAKKMVSPRYSSFTLEYERDYKVEKEAGGKVWNDLGLSLKLEYQGIVVEKVLPDSPAARSGIKANDLVAQVNGQSTRYMPMAKVMEIIRGGGQGSVSLSIRRSVILTRR